MCILHVSIVGVFALIFVRRVRSPMSIADYVVGSILVVIVLWALVKMPRLASRDHGGGKRRLFITLRATPARPSPLEGSW